MPGAALAAAPTVTVNGVSPSNVLSGGKVTLQYTVANNNGGLGGGNDQNTATVDFGLPGGVQCSDCGQQHQVTIAPGQNQSFTVHLTMPQVGAGQSSKFTVTVTATIGNEKGSDQGQVTVQGPDKPQSVRAITGTVKDTAGKGVSGARVGAQDSTGKSFSTVTTGSGTFSILSNDANPIAPGNIQVGAGKDGFGDGTVVSVQGEAGKTVKVTLVLKPLQASASASASASPSASTGSSLDPGSVLDTGPAAGPSVNLHSDDAAKNASQNSSSGSTLFVVLGALLVAAGIGAIVLVLMRRKNVTKTPGGPNDGDPTAMGGGPGMIPPSQGRFTDATRVGGVPVGGMGNPAAATMVAPRSGAPSMSDAPTMLHRPVPAAPEDEFPDPYGAPLPPQGGYVGAAAGGWDDQGASQYGAQNQYGQADDDYAGAGQYGAGNGQYGGQYAAEGAGQERFDEHTSLYQPESEQDGYGDYGQGGYGGAPGAAPYGAPGASQYGTPGAGQYGSGAAAGGAAAGAVGGQYGGGYGGRQEDDYGSGGGYQGAGGYGQEQPDQGGYGSWGAPAGGIDSGNGYVPQGGQGQSGQGQYGGGAYGGGAADGDAGAYGAGGQYGGGAAAGYDDRGGYDQGYDPQQVGGQQGAGPQGGGQYGGGPYGGAARPPQQPGGAYGYDQQPEEDNGGYGGRRGYEDDQQPSRRGGGGRRPSGY